MELATLILALLAFLCSLAALLRPYRGLNGEDLEQVRQDILDGTYLLDTDVDIAVQVNLDGVFMIGKGHLTHDLNGFHLTGCDGKLDYTQKPQSCYGLYADYYWYEIADTICIGNNDVLYYCFPKGGDPVAKTRLAVEELYKLKKKRKRNVPEGE